MQRLPLEGRADAVGVSSLITWSFGTFGHRGGFPQRIAIAVEHPIATVKREVDTRVFGLEFYPPCCCSKRKARMALFLGRLEAPLGGHARSLARALVREVGEERGRLFGWSRHGGPVGQMA